MNARHSYYFSLVLLLLPAVLCPAAGIKAQYIKKEQLPNKDGNKENFAVFYADGMPQSAQWPLGTIIMDQAGNTTTTAESNQINSKVAARFIISPFDVTAAGQTWANKCAWFGDPSKNPTGKYTNRKWRMPTQRELIVMMILQEGINTVYPSNKMTGKKYWSFTSGAEAGTAWVVDFTPNSPQVYPEATTDSNIKFRCVSDY